MDGVRQRLPGSVSTLGPAGVARLEGHLRAIVAGLPADLRRSLPGGMAAEDDTARSSTSLP
jgi:hypothetical protein